MWKELFKNAELLDVPVLVMLFFFAIFAVVLWRALSKSRTVHYQHMSQLPLDKES
jgi:hypothetical protein